MQRKWKIVLVVSVTVVVLIGGFIGIAKLLNYLKYNRPPETEVDADPPVLDFIFENISHIHRICGYGYIGSNFHNGIDFIINYSATNILAPCNMTMSAKELVYMSGVDHWAVKTEFVINEVYWMIIGFESFARNETFGNYQLDAILVDVNDTITKGQLIGPLFIHDGSAHIHFGLYNGSDTVCPYNYFSSTAKAIFDYLFPLLSIEDIPCNTTLSFDY